MGRTRIILGAVFIGGFIYLGLGAFTDTLTPYVTFSEAKASEGKNVQVTGMLTEQKESWYSRDEERTFNFYLIEEETGDTLSVSYHGVKPSTFEEATSIVAIGSFDGERFHANQVLTKCPSKYEGQDPSEHDEAYGRGAGD
ncbi:MAG: cytochrome c maturation protein CcmE [bacterium]